MNKIVNKTIIIVGTEQYSNNPANKLMFAGQAVREVREKLSDYPNLEVLIFEDGYTKNQLTAFSNAILSFNKKARVTQINTINEMINFINNGYTKAEKETLYREIHKISEVKIYSHGIICKNTNEGIITFGLNGKNENKQQLDTKTFNKIDKNVFLPDKKSNLYSYACRTGIGVANDLIVSGSPEKLNSLAQKMSNHGQLTVHAYMKRSEYRDTWGTQNHRDTYFSDYDKGETFLENLKTDLKDAFNSDPDDIKTFIEYITSEEKIDGALWNPKGAFMEVRAGDTPSGVSDNYEIYLPK